LATNKKPEENVGACGRACFACRWFERGLCLGCPAENTRLPAEEQCVIFRCARRKGAKTCLWCEEMPCNLRKELTASYCPVYDKNRSKFKDYLEQTKKRK